MIRFLCNLKFELEQKTTQVVERSLKTLNKIENPPFENLHYYSK